MQYSDEFTNRMLSAINDLMLDMLAAVARKDYQDRRRRQKEGMTKAIGQGKYLGRRENKDLQEKINLLLREGKSYTMIVRLLGCSRGTIAKVSRRIKDKLVALSIS